VEGFVKINWQNLCHEGYAKGQDHIQTFSSLCYELKDAFTKIKASFSCQHEIFFPESGESIFGDGLLQ
jgi:hypothetical protein